MKTANLAIVFTDIKGFTERTSQQTLEENQRLLAKHNELLSPLFKAFGGRIIKSIGDAFLVTFESPTQAVLSGLAIQDRLWSYNRTAVDKEQFHVRVAINVGEVRLEANDVFGEPVNIAARVEGIAEADEVFFTEAVYLSMNKAEVPAEEVGAFELKGIPGKIRVFRVPRAPYRVEPAGLNLLPPLSDPEQPPFGNLALSRVDDGGSFRTMTAEFGMKGIAATAEATAKAAAFGGEIAKRTTAAFSGANILERRGLLLRAGVGVGAVLGLFFLVRLLFGSELGRAMADVRGSEGPARAEKVEVAQRLIRAQQDPGEQAYWAGELEVAQDKASRAIGHYERAVRSKNDAGAGRLIELLTHESCEVRSGAARALGGLKWKGAKGELEDLHDDGGPGEGEGGMFFSCDSKKAAADALKRLE